MCRHRFIPVHEREIIYVYVNWLFAETHDFSTLQKKKLVQTILILMILVLKYRNYYNFLHICLSKSNDKFT